MSKNEPIAIVMNSIYGIKQIQYIIALGKITDSNNIIHTYPIIGFEFSSKTNR